MPMNVYKFDSFGLKSSCRWIENDGGYHLSLFSASLLTVWYDTTLLYLSVDPDCYLTG